jgi:hypothetical protein
MSKTTILIACDWGRIGDVRDVVDIHWQASGAGMS